jgi:hypothetical protein
MGWWKSGGAGIVVGDGPLDALGDARRRVVSEYQEAFGRRPTFAEWEELLRTVLGHSDEDARCSGDGIPTTVRLLVASRSDP